MTHTTPSDVPSEMQRTYNDSYETMTQGSGRLMLFAGDQKLEHLNDDYFGEGISAENNNPEHMFKIANQAKIGVFASQLGLIARYGPDYAKVPYMVKMNSKTHLVNVKQKDPWSKAWYTVDQVADFKKRSGLKVLAVGYTVYFGSEYEPKMLAEAAQIIYSAHQHGLLATIWAYPRGAAVTDEKDPHLTAGAAGASACLGADFVKVNPPKKEGTTSVEALREAVVAAGRTGLVCAGGSSTNVEDFLRGLHDQIAISGAAGNATGRNIHQKPLDQAVRFANAISAITIENKSVEDALEIYGRA